MPLPTATRLGPYEILAPLGAGGMGEVYRAKDTRLGREVAIKVLPAHLIDNPEVRARFEREARTISSLNHPHICTLHDVGREGETDFLVMELVDGETLAQRLTRGPIPMAELLRLAIQIADALDRAHRAGIVHRDFKPGNVMVTRSGAKLMDFGLARTGAAGGASPHSGSTGVTIAQLTQSPTLASPLTQQGSLIGTFLYMAPEQLDGKEADTRTDIWALGCVLYEMATGRRAFEGKTQASLIGSIMSSEPPPLAASGIAASPALEALIRACLAKDPEERIQTAHDVKLQLGWIAQSGAHSGVTGPLDLPKPRRSREPIAWAVAGLAIAAALFFAWRSTAPRTEGSRQIRFTIPLPAPVVTTEMPRVSPDGTMLAFAAIDSATRSMIWLRPLHSLEAHPLPGTEGSSRPFWSPDSRWLAFVAGGKLKKVPVSGGPPIVICDAPSGFDGTWGRNGDILFDGRAAIDPIMHVKASGGVASPAMPRDSVTGVGWPVFLADGRHFLYSTVPLVGAPQIMVGTLGQPKGRPLNVAGSRVEYSPDGHLLFARDNTLMAQRFDQRALKTIGDPFPVAEDLPVANNAQANFSVSANGVLIYRATGTLQSRLVLLDRTGREVQQVAGPGDYRAPVVSPDGRRVAVRRRDPGGASDVWLIDIARSTVSRFSFGEVDGNPLWSPDGSQLLWGHDDADSSQFVVKSAAGVGETRLVAKLGIKGFAVPLDWSRDGRHVVYQLFDPGTSVDLFTLRMDTPNPTREVLLQTPFLENRAQFSPDGRWVAYESDESGRSEVYVVSFGAAHPGKWQISTEGGSDPRWSRDGRELFYLFRGQRLKAVNVEPGDVFSAGTPRDVFRVQAEGGRRRNVYDVTPDGRFLFQVPVGEPNTPFTAVVNWRAGANAR